MALKIALISLLIAGVVFEKDVSQWVLILALWTLYESIGFWWVSCELNMTGDEKNEEQNKKDGKGKWFRALRCIFYSSWYLWHHYGASKVPIKLRNEFKTNVAGEVGAVALYLGLKRVVKDQEALLFIQKHESVEREHLQKAKALCGWYAQSLSTPLWWVLGFVAGFWGSRGAYVLVKEVESFVVEHYGEQLVAFEEDVSKLSESDQVLARRDAKAWHDFIRQAMNDEEHHRQEAQKANEKLCLSKTDGGRIDACGGSGQTGAGNPMDRMQESVWLLAWVKTVMWGSRAALAVIRHT